ncbi:MAG TPA: hypothetical protein PLK80_11805 [bacterium]|nr:MAG: hypothetical protein BWY28_01350 [bacterium ADurb.Bin236]HOY63635.1 hypothetical protein [bacterium]HPI77407.1 hypothetical protein [bacterium]HPN94543.1 hypothetical protein [bacterium]
MKKQFSLREISLELGIPKSTVVKYKDLYPDFFTLSGDGKRKKLDSGALEVLKAIRELREESKLDWPEINQTLIERFGAPKPKQPEASAEPQKALVPQTAASVEKIERLEHMVAILGGQMIKMNERLEMFMKRSEKAEAEAAVMAKSVARAERKIDLALGEMLKNDSGNKKFVVDLAETFRAEFGRLNATVSTLRHEMGEIKKNGLESMDAFAGALEEFRSKMEKTQSDNGAFQTKYQVALREIEVLRTKLRQMSAERTEQPAESPRQGTGWRTWLKRG